MHGAVLQNKKYIKFADENTVEVIAISQVDRAISEGNRKAERYKGKDSEGNEVEFLVEFPGLTVRQINALRSSKAGTYNNTGKIPYTAVIDPHTLEEMSNIRGGYGSGKLMELVTEAKKQLNKQHGKSISRKTLVKIRKAEDDVRGDLAKGKYAAALATARKLEAKMVKQPEALQAKARGVTESVLSAIGNRLDELEAAIERGELKQAGRELGSLTRTVKGTPLEERAAGLLEKTKVTE